MAQKEDQSMDGWDKVFNTGLHTDSNGNQKNWTTDDLDRIVASLNPSYHEPPVVIGHPSDNAPAWGWVEAAKRVGADLYLKYKDVQPEFKEWVARKLYKKRSISVYPDGSLRHIAFLGGVPPAIKGLPDYAFADSGRGQAVTYEFGDWTDEVKVSLWRKLKNYIIGEKGADVAEQVIPEYEMSVLERGAYRPEQLDNDKPCYTEPHKEEDMKPEEVKKMLDEALAVVTQQFGETVKGLQTTIAEMNKGIVAGREEGRRREFREFLMQPEMQRRVAEGSREATINHMVTLVGAAPIEFGEGDSKVTRPALEVYKEQLRALPEVVMFGEFAVKERATELTAVADAKKVGDKMDELMAAAKQRGVSMSYAEAHTQACRELNITTGGAQ